MAAHADSKKVGAPANGVQVTLSEFAITPTMISAPTGGKLVVTNAGAVDHSFVVEGTKPHVVETVPGWVHDITNVGSEELIVMLWANEIFDPEHPDTIAAKVAP